MSLEEHGGRVKSVHLFGLLLLLFSHDLLQDFSLPLFFDALLPLLTDLGKLVVLVVELGLGLVPVFVLLLHVSIVLAEGLLVLVVGVLELSQKSLLALTIIGLGGQMLTLELSDASVEFVHADLVSLLSLLPDVGTTGA